MQKQGAIETQLVSAPTSQLKPMEIVQTALTECWKDAECQNIAVNYKFMNLEDPFTGARNSIVHATISSYFGNNNTLGLHSVRFHFLEQSLT